MPTRAVTCPDCGAERTTGAAPGVRVSCPNGHLVRIPRGAPTVEGTPTPGPQPDDAAGAPTPAEPSPACPPDTSRPARARVRIVTDPLPPPVDEPDGPEPAELEEARRRKAQVFGRRGGAAHYRKVARRGA